MMIVECMAGEIIFKIIDISKEKRSRKKECVENDICISRSNNKENVDEDSTKKDSTFNDADFNLFNAVSYNALLFFLLSNLMTGLVNLSIATLYAGSIKAVTILIVYMLGLSGLVLFLYQNKISTKLW